MSDVLQMTPPPGERLLRFVGDRIRFTLSAPAGSDAWTAFLRTNLGRAEVIRDETVAAHGGAGVWAGASWRDVPMRRVAGGWELELALAEVGWFLAKPYAMAPDGRQRWPDGDDVGLAVHPAETRSANTIYCAFPRMFGIAKTAPATRIPLLDDQAKVFDQHGWTLIPPSGTLRDLTRELPHIMGTLGCRILHLLPVTPTPTTSARFGRFGSPYASQSLTTIDPALVEFDKITTAVDQFRELTTAVHRRGGQVLLDIIFNHTGWGSALLNQRPEWFRRNPDGTFHSPGAWGNTWEDLVELDHERGGSALWEMLAESLLEWCRRGVDGFRCDAGYMVPVPAWQFITARVRQHFPDTIFLLEGLGGAWSATETLLTTGGMQWAYSELFQNHAPRAVSGYLDHALGQGTRLGTLVHYSETHDNDRLAKRGRGWAWLRCALCALAGRNGAFGFTAGVEWLAAEKLEVHQARGLNWGAAPNLVEDLARLIRLVSDHPCFLDGASIRRLSGDDAQVVALERLSAEGTDRCLVLVNLDPVQAGSFPVLAAQWRELGAPGHDLLGDVVSTRAEGDQVRVELAPGAAHCLTTTEVPAGLSGDGYRRARAQLAFATQALCTVLPAEAIGDRGGWQRLAAWMAESPARFLAALARVDPTEAAVDACAALAKATARSGPPLVIPVDRYDRNRVVCVPPGHWLLVLDDAPFDARIHRQGDGNVHRRSTPWDRGHCLALPPGEPGDLVISWRRRGTDAELLAETLLSIRLLPAAATAGALTSSDGLALLTNGRGGMARLHADLGRIASKYDCLLGANLHPSVPCDRHIFAKRLRAWVVADGFITPLDGPRLAEFSAGPPASWAFVAHAGDGRTVEIHLGVDLVPGENTVVMRFHRPAGSPRWGADLPADRRVHVVVRLDLEDRSFHQETRRDDALDRHWRASLRPLPGGAGFRFAPAPDRAIEAQCDHGTWHDEPEWSLGIQHPIEAERGMNGQGDAFSPGWFGLPLAPGAIATVQLAAESAAEPLRRGDPASPDPLADITHLRSKRLVEHLAQAGLSDPRDAGDSSQAPPSPLAIRLAAALDAFLVRRGAGTTVIAGYPWFLDWGRDTFIAGRGLLAAGRTDEVQQILQTFARFVDRGTLPNILAGEEAANRDTSDAPLWFALLAEELAAIRPGLWNEPLPATQRQSVGTLAEAVAAIAAGYLAGTPNGIRVDPASALVFSPAHFTWMDTNHPAATPRTGYPIEIQALWIRLMRRCAVLAAPCPDRRGWTGLADLATASLERYWLEDRGWFGDQLAAQAQPSASSSAAAAETARLDDALRPNQLLLVTLGLVHGPRARRMVDACRRWLLVPGALRSLAPLSVDLPLAVIHNGKLLNDPLRPYFGRYEGDEDTRRKPAYHNGTGWVWLLPLFCEAYALAWDRHPDAVAAARAWLASCAPLLGGGCIGQLPELVDGDAPHRERGCDAQAWSIAEALRVEKLLS